MFNLLLTIKLFIMYFFKITFVPYDGAKPFIMVVPSCTLAESLLSIFDAGYHVLSLTKDFYVRDCSNRD